jgi:hypothetical protein
VRAVFVPGPVSLLVLLLSAGVASPRDVSGTIATDTEWSGEIRLAGDVIVERGATLRILPGTRIIAKPLAGPRGESSPHDLRPELAEVHVFGAIEARGTAEERIEIGTNPEIPDPAKAPDGNLDPTWLGIVLHPGREAPSAFHHVTMRGAHGALQCTDGSPEVEDCLFFLCNVGVGAGTAWGDPRGRRRVRGHTPGPAIRRCRFGQCDTGVYVDGAGRPVVERCVFLDCRIGIGPRAGAVTGGQHGLGALVDRCDFLFNRVAVQGSGSVRNSVFLENRLAFAASRFHRRHTVLIDRYHRAGNVYSGNGRLADDDIPLGESALHADPGYRGPVERSLALLLLPDLDRVLALRPDSPARGRATDGGDPGAFGGVGTLRTGGRGKPPAGTVALTTWLLPGPVGSFTAEDVAAVKKAIRRGRPPEPGRRIGRGIWAVFPVEEGALRLPRGLGEAVVLVAVEAAGPGTATLHLGLDGELLEAFWGENALPLPENPRRFDPADLSFEVALEEGANVLLLRLAPADPGARLAAHLGGERPGSPWEAPPAKTSPPVEILSAAGRRGRRPGRAILTLDRPVHWLDAGRRETWRLLGPDGTPAAWEPDGRVEYDAKRRRVELTGLRLESGKVYRLEFEGLRDAWGRPLESPAEPPVVTAR